MALLSPFIQVSEVASVYIVSHLRSRLTMNRTPCQKLGKKKKKKKKKTKGDDFSWV